MTVYKLTSKIKTTSFIGSPAKGAPKVRIIDGIGYTEDEAFVRWARAAGYTVEEVESVPADYALAAGVLDGQSFELIGTPLCDAAVDPRPGDNFAPVHAVLVDQDGNPHGPNVVSVQALSPRSGRPPFVSGQRYEPATVETNSSAGQ